MLSGFDLVGKVVVVTGASSGIGAATVRRLREEGASVLACDRAPPPPATPLAAAGTPDAARLAFEPCEVTRP
ncbi:MAG: SDR family NAD(P)-dependent oxidoreductase, partial [Planctomycetes bacterium]|nr:SDR family NAD(P)-dependent oxidoreductase [Planctomycetota bacterium]